MGATLSLRLQQIAAFVDENETILDVGSDHALLPIYLVQQEIIPFAYVSDNKQGPLNRAIKNIQQFHLQERIQPLFGDGLLPLKDDVTTIIIAGMGGHLITSILEAGLAKIKDSQTLILQPNQHLYVVRKWLNEHDFTILDEAIIEEDRRYYEIMKIKKGKQVLNELDFTFGPKIRQVKNETFQKKVHGEIRKYHALLAKIDHPERKTEIEQTIKLLEEVL